MENLSPIKYPPCTATTRHAIHHRSPSGTIFPFISCFSLSLSSVYCFCCTFDAFLPSDRLSSLPYPATFPLLFDRATLCCCSRPQPRTHSCSAIFYCGSGPPEGPAREHRDCDNSWLPTRGAAFPRSHLSMRAALLSLGSYAVSLFTFLSFFLTRRRRCSQFFFLCAPLFCSAPK